MFKDKLRTLCEECDWIVKCGRTREGYRHHYDTPYIVGHEAADAIYDADIVTLYEYAAAVVAAGRRSCMTNRREIAHDLKTLITSDEYTTDDLIDTFEGITFAS